MEKFKSVLSTAAIVIVMIAIFIGWSNYKQHQLQQRMRHQLQLQQSAPRGGMVVDQDGTVRWQN